MPAIDVTPPLICDPMVLPPIPTLPSGYSIGTAIPPIIGPPFSVRLCCKVVQFTPKTPPIALGIGVNVALLQALNTAIGVVNTYVRALAVRCPKE